MRRIILLFIIVVVGCTSKTSDKTIQQIEATQGVEVKYKEPKITGEKYFDFDELIHYNNDVSEDKIGEIFDNEKKSELGSLKKGIILAEIPTEITGENFLNQLESIGYKKNIIGSEKFNKINEIFTEKKHEMVEEAACMYVYRDILIFKKKSKIIGVAKICFECGDSKIVGTKSNTDEFGQSGDYWKLEELLYGK